jgi:hypothetical protein
VGDGGTIRSVLGDGEGVLWRCSSFENQRYSFTLLLSSSSFGQLLQTSMNRACAVAIFVRQGLRLAGENSMSTDRHL